MANYTLDMNELVLGIRSEVNDEVYFDSIPSAGKWIIIQKKLPEPGLCAASAVNGCA